jgi:CRISPR-associated protein Cas1
MGELAARVWAEGSLLTAWEQVRENAYDDGDPGTAVAAFEHAALSRLTVLARTLRDGSWQPRPVTAVEIPNPAGGVRRLAIGAVEDRIVERAVLPELDRLIDPLLSPWSFAYRRGLGVPDAIRALAAARDAGARWVARTDIDDCFDEIPRWEVLRRLREVVRDPELLALVERLMDRPVAGAHAGDRGGACTRAVGCRRCWRTCTWTTSTAG